jgi:alcohol dehydrogenase YqhD (iron-dependent ADH family)
MEKIFQDFNYVMRTELVFGKDAELKTGKMIKKYGGTKAIIVIDGGGFVKNSGLLDRVISSLNGESISYVLLEGVQPNPRLTLALKGIELSKKEKVDFVLAIGGGSTIDTAKTIALQMAYDGDVMDFYNGIVPEKMIPVGSIATIAGTGSESSGSAVIYDDISTKTKLSFMYNHIRCSFAILNPEITYSLPKFQTGAGSADIFAHAFDSYMTYSTSFLGDSFAEAAMKTAVKYGPLAIQDPTNYEYRSELLLDASFAHNDTCRIGRDGFPSGGAHLIEAHMTAVFDTAHGAGLSVLMPAILQYGIDHYEETWPKIAQLSNKVFDVVVDPKDLKSTCQIGINRLRHWLKDELGMPSTLTELARREITDDDMENIMSRVPEGPIYYCKLTKKDIRELLELVRK